MVKSILRLSRKQWTYTCTDARRLLNHQPSYTVLSMERYTDIIGRTPTYKILDDLQSYSLND